MTTVLSGEGLALVQETETSYYYSYPTVQVALRWLRDGVLTGSYGYGRGSGGAVTQRTLHLRPGEDATALFFSPVVSISTALQAYEEKNADGVITKVSVVFGGDVLAVDFTAGTDGGAAPADGDPPVVFEGSELMRVHGKVHATGNMHTNASGLFSGSGTSASSYVYGTAEGILLKDAQTGVPVDLYAREMTVEPA